MMSNNLITHLRSSVLRLTILAALFAMGSFGNAEVTASPPAEQQPVTTSSTTQLIATSKVMNDPRQPLAARQEAARSMASATVDISTVTPVILDGLRNGDDTTRGYCLLALQHSLNIDYAAGVAAINKFYSHGLETDVRTKEAVETLSCVAWNPSYTPVWTPDSKLQTLAVTLGATAPAAYDYGTDEYHSDPYYRASEQHPFRMKLLKLIAVYLADSNAQVRELAARALHSMGNSAMGESPIWPVGGTGLSRNEIIRRQNVSQERAEMTAIAPAAIRVTAQTEPKLSTDLQRQENQHFYPEITG